MIQSLYSLVEDGHPISQDYPAIPDWPWTWIRTRGYVKVVRSIHERAAMDPTPEEALPPRWMWFNHSEELAEWWESRTKGKGDATDNRES